MNHSMVALVSILVLLASSPAFAYKRDVSSMKPAEKNVPEEQQADAPSDEEAVEAPTATSGSDWGYDEDVYKRPKGQGTVTAGYILVAVGGAAAIAGSAISLASNDHRTLGIIVGSSGAAMGLAGSLMIMLGSQNMYSVGPTVDPVRGNYGLAMAAKF